MATTRKKATRDRPDDPWLSLPQAARALGVSRQTVLLRASRGELDSLSAAGRVLVARASVERAIDEQKHGSKAA